MGALLHVDKTNHDGILSIHLYIWRVDNYKMMKQSYETVWLSNEIYVRNVIRINKI